MTARLGRSDADGSRVAIRRAEPADLDAIIAVCAAALEWDPGAPNGAFFRWKHLESPFGPSPMWLAEDDGQLVGVRAMMRWRLRGPSGEHLDLVRAVDTATLPSHQGRGIFSRLTMAAVDELRAEGVAAVFNTPNDKSRPGYLKMGWAEVGHVPITARPASLRAVATMARSRTPADKWGTPATFGLDPSVALASPEMAALCAAAVDDTGWTTEASPDYYRWRYGLAALHHRIVLLGSSLGDGFAACRVRQRGPLHELTLDDVVAPAGHRRHRLARVLAESDAHAALAARPTAGPGDGFAPLPRIGPVLTWRPLERPGPPPKPLRLSLGAIEPF